MILKYVNYRLLQDCSAGRGVFYKVMMLIKITGGSVKFI